MFLFALKNIKKYILVGVAVLIVIPAIILGAFYVRYDPDGMFAPPTIDDPGFSLAEFKFEDYLRSDDIAAILKQHIRPGMPRAEVEAIITRAGGIRGQSGEFDENLGWRYARGRELGELTFHSYVDFSMPIYRIPLIPNLTPGSSRVVSPYYDDDLHP